MNKNDSKKLRNEYLARCVPLASVKARFEELLNMCGATSAYVAPLPSSGKDAHLFQVTLNANSAEKFYAIAHNPNNRSVTQNNRTKYVNTIDNGQWDESNSDTIAVDSFMIMMNGHHRTSSLAASISGRNITFLVVAGSEQKVFDDGRPRTQAQQMKMVGDQEYAKFSSAIKGVVGLATGSLTKVLYGKANMFEIAKKWFPAITDVFDIVSPALKAHPELKKGMMLSACIMAHKKNSSEVEKFLDTWINGSQDTVYQSNVNLLRNWILSVTTGQGSISEYHAKLSLYVLQACVQNQTLVVLPSSGDGSLDLATAFFK